MRIMVPAFGFDTPLPPRPEFQRCNNLVNARDQQWLKLFSSLFTPSMLFPVPIWYIVLDIGMGDIDLQDPASRPWGATDDYGFTVRDKINAIHGLGIYILGYVPTNNGRQNPAQRDPQTNRLIRPGRTLADVKGYIDRWYGGFPDLDGIFFDEGPCPV